MKASTQAKEKTVFLPFNSVRHISSPEDTENGRKIYVGQTPIQAILHLPTDENVRDYLLEAEGRQRKRPTQVHKAILDTIKEKPDQFSVLNSGVVIVARECVIDDGAKVLKLTKPSIINGSQTQGVIKDFFLGVDEDTIENYRAHVKFEVIVTSDEELIAEISIARNFQNDVMSLSIAGRLGQLDELELALEAKKPGLKLQKSETKLSEDYIKTERLLQVITALIPEELWVKKGEINKVFTYSMKAKCLKDFQETYKKANDPGDPDHVLNLNLYKFMLDIAAEALDLYEKWKKHQGFKGTGLRSISREGSEIIDVPDGIVFSNLGISISICGKN